LPQVELRQNSTSMAGLERLSRRLRVDKRPWAGSNRTFLSQHTMRATHHYFSENDPAQWFTEQRQAHRVVENHGGTPPAAGQCSYGPQLSRRRSAISWQLRETDAFSPRLGMTLSGLGDPNDLRGESGGGTVSRSGRRRERAYICLMALDVYSPSLRTALAKLRVHCCW
jgi:hypothetical protein